MSQSGPTSCDPRAMPHLAPCPGCARHVRVDERACPFCASQLDLSGVPAPRPVPGRLSRAALFALGAALTAGGIDGCATQSAAYGAPAADPSTGNEVEATPPPSDDDDDEGEPDAGTQTAPPQDPNTMAPAYGAPPPQQNQPPGGPAAAYGAPPSSSP